MQYTIVGNGHAGMMGPYYLMGGSKQSPVVAPNVGVYEGEFNRIVAELLCKKIGKTAINLNTGQCTVPRRFRKRDINWFAKKEDCVYVEIHANAMGHSHWRSGTGSRVFIRKPPRWFAKKKADYKMSKAIAGNITRSFKKMHRLGDIPYPTRRVRNDTNFGMLLVNCPAVLIETGFMTNKIDAAFLASTKGPEIIAETIYRGLL